VWSQELVPFWDGWTDFGWSKEFGEAGLRYLSELVRGNDGLSIKVSYSWGYISGKQADEILKGVWSGDCARTVAAEFVRRKWTQIAEAITSAILRDAMPGRVVREVGSCHALPVSAMNNGVKIFSKIDQIYLIYSLTSVSNSSDASASIDEKDEVD